MDNDIRTGGRVVLEAHSGHQVNEESIALLPELSMLVDKNPTQNKREKSYTGFIKMYDMPESRSMTLTRSYEGTNNSIR